jgi:glutathione S-transferase
MKLYHVTVSGHSHRARLFLSILGVDIELVELDRSGLRSPDFLRRNPSGRFPYWWTWRRSSGGKDWLLEGAAEAAAVQKWLTAAAKEIAGPCAARLMAVFDPPLDARDVIAKAHKILKLLNHALDARDWIVDSRPTIADLALYSYTSHAAEGNVDVSGYANILPWLKRVGFLPFPQTAVGLRASCSNG